jgi:hypothetical protein
VLGLGDLDGQRVRWVRSFFHAGNQRLSAEQAITKLKQLLLAPRSRSHAGIGGGNRNRAAAV